MPSMDFFIRPATAKTSADWIRFQNADISVRIARRITRTVVRGGEAKLLPFGGESGDLRGEALALASVRRSCLRCSSCFRSGEAGSSRRACQPLAAA